jgi:hypothetical protein
MVLRALEYIVRIVRIVRTLGIASDLSVIFSITCGRYHSILVFLIEELDSFEKDFSVLIEKVKDKIKDKIKGKDFGDITYSKNEIAFFTYFFVVYQQFIGMLVLHAISTWPAKLNNEDTLKRLYAMLFSWLRKIQLNLTNVFDFRSYNPYTYYIDVQATMAQAWFVLQPQYMKDLLCIAKEYDAVSEIENIFDVVWKISKPFFRYSMWANTPESGKQSKDDSMFYKDRNSKQLAELNPENWREPLIKWESQQKQ